MAVEVGTVMEVMVGARLCSETAITADHNHVALERHGGRALWVHRKERGTLKGVRGRSVRQAGSTFGRSADVIRKKRPSEGEGRHRHGASRRSGERGTVKGVRGRTPPDQDWLRGPATSGTCSCGAARRDPGKELVIPSPSDT